LKARCRLEDCIYITPNIAVLKYTKTKIKCLSVTLRRRFSVVCAQLPTRLKEGRGDLN